MSLFMVSKDDILLARRRLGENQQQFGVRFGVGKQTVCRWETDGIPASGAARVLIERVLADLASPRDGHPDPNPVSGTV